ncbi:MAG: TetR/AcrR family transcriptional regulator [Candidatus Dactylopiibacterium sp.]|nr:TetR/AcrR family transcriptional regulator [Candidatus Dactylopiibacterium sp.]
MPLRDDTSPPQPPAPMRPARPTRVASAAARATLREEPARPARTNDPERTMAEILAAATQEFAAKGLDGARIDAIADATRTSKRMIYYYFGSKEKLYRTVLEEAYRRMRETEAGLHLADQPPEAALARLVDFTFEHHWQNQDYIRLVMTENILRGEYLAQSRIIQKLNVPAIAAIRELYERGVADGVFRAGLDALDLHASISALCFFNVSNQHTFDLIFKRDGSTPRALAARRASIVDMILRHVRA